MITKKQYVEYLISTPKNCTCTYLAEHLEEVSHEVVNDFLCQKRFMPRDVWKLVQERSEESKEAYLIVDDSVHDKRYSRFIELVRRQYSGNEHRVIKGIGVVSLGIVQAKRGISIRLILGCMPRRWRARPRPTISKRGASTP